MTMNSALFIFFVLTSLLQLGLCNDEAKEILEYLRLGEQQVQPSTQKNIIFVLGSTGTGKTTLVHFLAGNPSFLRSVSSSDEDDDDFIIEHLYSDKIGNVTFESKTIFPDLLVDAENNLPYYDCPGFSDTRSTSIEISTTYFTKKVINHANRLKIAFVVNFHSMIKGASSRSDFAEFVQHATKFLKNVKFYENAIILVASKVPVHSGGDVKLLNKVRSFLKEYRTFLADNAKSNDDVTNKINLIDIFLSDGRIVLFRRPTAPGILSRLPDMMENRRSLQNALNDRISFVERNFDDFGYTLSDRSKLKITALSEEINSKITNLFGEISRRVIEDYSKTSVNLNDILSIQIELDNVINSLTTLSIDNRPLKRLNISDRHRILAELVNHMKYIDFFETVYDAPIARRTSDWAEALRNCTEYLAKEKNWYSFADSLRYRLSQYDIQSDASKYDVGDMEHWGIGDAGATSGIWITPENFRIFLQKVMAFGLIEDANASSSKIDLLNDILNATIKSRTSFLCHGNKLTVTGNFVKISALAQHEILCNHPVELIEVFGMSTIFFDSNFERNVNLIAIAPKWNVIHEHVRIVLDGADGMDGFDGNPGMAGQNAKHFYGYANELVNGENLFVSAVGGNGGRGGNGHDAHDGHNVMVPEEGSEFAGSYVREVSSFTNKDMGFLWFNQKQHTYDTYESSDNCPSLNGLGGSGGSAGLGGTIEVNGMLGIETSIKDGKNGHNGLTGKCGKIYERVELYKTTAEKCWFWVFCDTEISWKGRRYEDYSCLKNCRESTQLNVLTPTPAMANKQPNYAESITHYKTFARENLHQMPKSFVIDFLRSIESNSQIRAVYDTKSFIADFYHIEQLYTTTYSDDWKVFSYQSLLERIVEYASNSSNKVQSEERQILANLYTAGLSKLCKMRSGTEQNLIVDIESYLDVAIEHITLLEKRGKQAVLNQFKRKYRRSLQLKIDENLAIVTKDIRPEIERLLSDIDVSIERCMDQLLERKKSISAAKDRNDEMRKKLKEQLVIPRGILNFLSVVADIAGLFSGFGRVVSRTLNTVNQVAYALTADKSRMPSDRIHYSSSSAAASLTNEWNSTYRQMESSNKFLRTRKSLALLTVIDEILEMATGFSFADVFDQVTGLRKKVMADKVVDLNSEEIELLHGDIRKVIEKKIVKMKTNSNNKTNSLNALTKMYKKLSVLQANVDLFNKFSSNDQQLDEIDSVTSESETKLSELNHLERDFRRSIIPMARNMTSLLTKLSGKLDNDDHSTASLASIKWHFQSTLKRIRHQMQEFRNVDWKLTGKLFHLFDQLDAALSFLSNIFDRLEIYEGQIKLSNYIANIESADYHGGTSSTSESDDFNRLNIIIESNVLLTIFANAINGFKQTVFPFAEFYLRRFKLPPQLETDTNLKSLVTKATDELINLKLTLKEYYSASINPSDNLIHTADFSSNFTSSQPFYIWNADEHRELITNLLSGKNVTVKVDITKGPKLNAVKFQYLQIHLRASNKSSQSELDKLLEHFDVTVIHHGNSYYRCDDKFYLITSPAQRIVYSFEKDSNGLPMRRNNVYQKMWKGNFVLSPYALLTISLKAQIPEQFSILKSNFDQNVDLELIGRGQYLNPLVGDTCSDLGKFYAADEVLSNNF